MAVIVHVRHLLFQSTLPAWGETARCGIASVKAAISIHSPRMGRDKAIAALTYVAPISIHSPRMGRDRRSRPFFPQNLHFNPLSPHGERQKHGRR